MRLPWHLRSLVKAGLSRGGMRRIVRQALYGAFVIAASVLIPYCTAVAANGSVPIELTYESCGLQRNADGTIVPGFWLDEGEMLLYVSDIAKGQVIVRDRDGKLERIVLRDPIAVGAIAITEDLMYLTDFYGSTTIYIYDFSGNLRGTLQAPIPPHSEQYEGAMDIIDLNVIAGRLVATFLNGGQVAFDGEQWSEFGLQDIRLDTPGALLPVDSGEWTKELRQATAYSFSCDGANVTLETVNELFKIRKIGNLSTEQYFYGRDLISSEEFREVIAVVGPGEAPILWYLDNFEDRLLEHKQVGSNGQVYMATRGDRSLKIYQVTGGNDTAKASLWAIKAALVDEKVPKLAFGPPVGYALLALFVLAVAVFTWKRVQRKV